MLRLWAEAAGVSYKEQVGSSALTSSHYQHSSWSERAKPPGMGVKPLSKTFKIWVSTLALHLNPSLSSFYSPSLCSLQRRRKGGGVYLTLICPVVSFREMTCNLRGKGQLFLFPLFWEPIYSPRGLFSKAANYFRFCHIVFDSLSWKQLKEPGPSLSLFSIILQPI